MAKKKPAPVDPHSVAVPAKQVDVRPMRNNYDPKFVEERLEIYKNELWQDVERLKKHRPAVKHNLPLYPQFATETDYLRHWLVTPMTVGKTDCTIDKWHPLILEYCRTLGADANAVDRLYQRIVVGDLSDERAVVSNAEKGFAELDIAITLAHEQWLSGEPVIHNPPANPAPPQPAGPADTTPPYPRPDNDRMTSAISAAVWVAQQFGPTSCIRDCDLLKCIVHRGATIPQAMWALHELVLQGAVQAFHRDEPTGYRPRPYLVTGNNLPPGVTMATGVVDVGNGNWGKMLFASDLERLNQIPVTRHDNGKKSENSLPENPDVLELCRHLKAKRSKFGTDIECARDFCRKGLGDESKADNLLRQAKRFRHLWPK